MIEAPTFQHYDWVDWSQPVNWDSTLNDGLVSWWGVVPGIMGYGSTTIRDFCHRNDGTLTNGPTWNGALGRKGGYGSLSLTAVSNQYVDCGRTVSDLFGSSPPGVTVAWWQNPSAAFNSGTIRAIWGAASGGVPAFDAQVYFDNNWYVGFSATGTDDRVILAASAANWPQNEWSYYAFTSVIGGVSTLYRNGVSLGTNGGSTAYRTPTSTFRIGREGDIANYFGGYVDDFKLFSRALSGSEVLSLYRVSSTGYQNELNWVRRSAFAGATAASGFKPAWASTRRYQVIGGGIT